MLLGLRPARGERLDSHRRFGSAGIVFAALLLCRRIDAVEFASLSILALGSYFTINHFSGLTGWPALFYNSFLGGLINPEEVELHFSRSAYLHQVVRGSFLWLIYGSFALYVLLGGLAIWLGRNALYAYMVVAVLTARAVSRFLIPMATSATPRSFTSSFWSP